MGDIPSSKPKPRNSSTHGNDESSKAEGEVVRARFTFSDIFAGAGGGRFALERLEGRCVFSCELDKFAQRTYQANFGETPYGDIFDVSPKSVPPHNILFAGFPCQPFSHAGKGKGLRDPRAQVIFPLFEVIEVAKPSAFILENVNGLLGKRHVHSLQYILGVLTKELGYYIPPVQTLKASDFGLAQKRERVFIVGFRKSLGVEGFSYPEKGNDRSKISDILEPSHSVGQWLLTKKSLACLRDHSSKQKLAGNGHGYAILDENELANCLAVGGMGWTRNLIVDVSAMRTSLEQNTEGIRRMTPREWARLQGFPDSFTFPVSATQAFKQLGNAVAVPVIEALAKQVLDALGL
ncbi:C-5 cytosine-specific DNA methylase superfamily [Verrucomicrobiia bacterium DG1235]|nr:C-5 cytosine-specific DNA methylase superfamily [Verrucomicrobiae bacterium DG1235]